MDRISYINNLLKLASECDNKRQYQKANKITNLLNNKVYIGQSSFNWEDTLNYYGSGTLIEKAINAHGRESFKKELLEVCIDKASLDIAEKYWMDVHKGISIDHLPGEAVLELRVSYFDPFCDDSEIENKFGDKPNLKFEESVFRFAFTFKDGLIFTIRVPKKCTADILNLSQNN